MDKTKGDQRIYAHLLPIGETFKLEFFVKPLPEEDQYFKPGKGRHKVIGEVSGQRFLAERDMAKEIETGRSGHPRLPDPTKNWCTRDYEWQVDEVEDCLGILLELQPLRALDRIVLEHPPRRNASA